MPEQKESREIGGVISFQNKLHEFFYEDGVSDRGTWSPPYVSPLYAMEMNGSSPNEAMDLPAPKIYTDGEFLYVSNASTIASLEGSSNEGRTAKVWVYDKDYQIVDTFSEEVYNQYLFDFAMGIGDFGYRILRDEEDEFYGCLQRFDKSQIGTMDGKKAEFTTVAELTGSPADRSYRDFMKNGYRTDFFDGSFFDT